MNVLVCMRNFVCVKTLVDRSSGSDDKASGFKI